jgi:hypothetical protein
MPKVNWPKVQTDIEACLKGDLGSAWGNVSSAAVPQIQAMIAIARNIEAQYASGKLTEDEYKSLRSMQKNALEGILSAYQGIGIVAAEQAADAAWKMISSALLGAAGIPFA